MFKINKKGTDTQPAPIQISDNRFYILDGLFPTVNHFFAENMISDGDNIININQTVFVNIPRGKAFVNQQFFAENMVAQGYNIVDVDFAVACGVADFV